MKRIVFFAVLSLFAIANAAAGPPEPIRQEILTHAHAAKKGVIVAVTEQGDIAAETAWLLSAQVTRDNDYAPYLLVIKPSERERVLKTLGLAYTALPALIYYNRKGVEISRVVCAQPSRLAKQAGNNSIILD